VGILNIKEVSTIIQKGIRSGYLNSQSGHFVDFIDQQRQMVKRMFEKYLLACAKHQ
jgi:hypothetical protein